jgi:hypothetical protein
MTTEQKKVLVTAGNLNQKTFFGVCYAVKNKVGLVDVIHIFDTLDSEKEAAKIHRDRQLRELLKSTLSIRTSIVDDTNLQDVIPNDIAGLIREFGLDNIIIDLTNGQKITASVLYAVSTISRLANIYTLELFDRTLLDKPLREWPTNSWHYAKIESLKEILNITQSSYVELIYYRDRITSLVAELEKKNSELASETRDRLEQSLVDYFTLVSLTASARTERLERCVNGLGKICEDVARIWYEVALSKNLLNSSKSLQTDFNGFLTQIVPAWDRYRGDSAKNLIDKTNPEIVKNVLPVINTDMLLKTMQTYRNIASHANRNYILSQQDARISLDLTLLIIEKLTQTELLTKIGSSPPIISP